MQNKIINGPTILTLIRILLAIPLLPLMFSEEIGMKIVALGCFVMAGLTDIIDGVWARGRNKVTDLGAFLDPLADKILVNLVFLGLVTINVISVYWFVVILVRDFSVDGMRMMMARKGKTVSASIFGKIKTVLQMITLGLFLLNMIIMNTVLNSINYVFLSIALIMTIYSGMDYLVKGWKELEK